MAKRGRPTTYKPEYAKLAQDYCERGLTDWEISRIIGCEVKAISEWRAKHSEFADALKSGKTVADERVERSLYSRAVGYHFDAVKIFNDKDTGIVYAPYVEHVPPDTTACIFWLKNRRRDLWRDKHEFDLNDRSDPSNWTREELVAFLNNARNGGTGTAQANGSGSKPH